MKILKTANYEKLCKEAGVWDNIKGVGKGLYDLGGGAVGLINNLLKAGVSMAEITKALYNALGNKGVGKGVWNAGGGVFGLIKNLLAAGISMAEITKALYDVFDNILKIPEDMANQSVANKGR
jgi:hypothetical protein